ncbi:hypothetical protein SD70_17835 [Gordoniibacillus kamchatkensis]|uniref:Terpene synthase n=1 Tax=Gordoniibacillus kamchatkensis TaxID=1590651 RepID=A0ABR5AFI5_9BACL|nr:hypothetical protein [Paenibacillus sp. VKM B-2647]KIL39804.1 hypothetical protein SD70_17835 [Paenibacillus sp. VKM B-2647]
MDWLEPYRSELREVFAEAERVCGRLPAPVAKMAAAYLDKFSIQNEGSGKNYICYTLPFWMKEETRLNPELYRQLSLANVFLMLHFFIQDDLMDSGMPNCREMLPLANFMQHEYMSVYQILFPPESSFWSYYRTYLSEWADAVLHENDPGYFAERHGRLAHKASPVKLASTGSLLLADKHELIPAVSDIVDAVLDTLQTVDDYADWQEDLADGNYNALVALVRSLLPEGEAVTESVMHKWIYDRSVLDLYAQNAADRHRSLRQQPFNLPDLVSFHGSLVDNLVSAAATIENEKSRLISGGLYYLLSKEGKIG